MGFLSKDQNWYTDRNTWRLACAWIVTIGFEIWWKCLETRWIRGDDSHGRNLNQDQAKQRCFILECSDMTWRVAHHFVASKHAATIFKTPILQKNITSISPFSKSLLEVVTLKSVDKGEVPKATCQVLSLLLFTVHRRCDRNKQSAPPYHLYLCRVHF